MAVEEDERVDREGEGGKAVVCEERRRFRSVDAFYTLPGAVSDFRWGPQLPGASSLRRPPPHASNAHVAPVTVVSNTDERLINQGF